jgi:hypothetical protein
MPAVEVVYPTDSPGPLDSYLVEFPELVYHLCFVADDITAAVDAIKTQGGRVLPVAPPKAAVLFGGRQVGFYLVRGLGLIEILEEK